MRAYGGAQRCGVVTSQTRVDTGWMRGIDALFYDKARGGERKEKERNEEFTPPRRRRRYAFFCPAMRFGGRLCRPAHAGCQAGGVSSKIGRSPPAFLFRGGGGGGGWVLVGSAGAKVGGAVGVLRVVCGIIDID